MGMLTYKGELEENDFTSSITAGDPFLSLLLM